MSLSITDARVFSDALKKAREKKHLTQAECAELLDCSLSFQKDLERCRCSPSIESYYHICRTLDISADDCIFQDSQDRTGSAYYSLLRMLPLCDEEKIRILAAVASTLIGPGKNTASSGMPADIPAAE